MNWPNRLSLIRIALVPFIILMMYVNLPASYIIALALFALASFTDFLDGQIARRRHLVTNFGKFIDPVADKLLVLSTMIGLCGQGWIPAWACVVVLFRELAVDGLRLVAVEQGRVIAAGKLGKIKTCTQMLTVILHLLAASGFAMALWPEVTLYLAVAMTLLSGVDYFVKNRGVFSDTQSPAAELEQVSRRVVEAFTREGMTLGTAESLTGGMIAASVAGVSGASAVLMGGVVSYDPKVKHDSLGVEQAVIDTVGVVSEPCARQMAEGARKALHVDVAVSATGIAGPTGGTSENPVGTVFIGVATANQTKVEECHFTGDRQSVRQQSAAHALKMALDMAKR